MLDASEFLGAALPTATLARQAQAALQAMAAMQAAGGSQGHGAGHGAGHGHGHAGSRPTSAAAAAAVAASGGSALALAFQHFDADGSGYITVDELRGALATHHPDGDGPDVRVGGRARGEGREGCGAVGAWDGQLGSGFRVWGMRALDVAHRVQGGGCCPDWTCTLARCTLYLNPVFALPVFPRLCCVTWTLTATGGCRTPSSCPCWPRRTRRSGRARRARRRRTRRRGGRARSTARWGCGQGQCRALTGP